MNQQYRYTLDDIKTAANGRWEGILSALGVPEHLLNTRKHQSCPACGGKNRFRFTNHGGRGWFICNQCRPQGGSGFDLLMLVFGYSFEEALKRVTDVLGMGSSHHLQAAKPRLPPSNDAAKANKQDHANELKLKKIWDSCQSWQSHHIIADYLRGRGIPEPESLLFDDDALRVHYSLAYWHNGACLGRFPAMVGAFRTADGALVGLHLTYLMRKNQHTFKAILKDVKTGNDLDAKKHRAIYSGALSGAAVPLFGLPEDGRLAVCEGIETAAAIHCVSGLAVWACGAANRIAAFRLPERVKRLIVIADNDANGTGIRAATQLQQRYHKQLNGNIKIWQPSECGCDVLDILARETIGNHHE